MTPAVKLFTPLAAAALLFGAMPDSVRAAPSTKKVCKNHTHTGVGIAAPTPQAEISAAKAWQSAVTQHDGASWARVFTRPTLSANCVQTGHVYKDGKHQYKCTYTARPCRMEKTTSGPTTSMPH